MSLTDLTHKSSQTGVARRAVGGVLPVGLLLLGTRWSGYLGLRSLYLTDVLLIASALVALGRNRLRIRWSNGTIILAACAMFFSVRFLLGLRFGFVPLRDGAPYLYVAIAFISMYGARASTIRSRSWTARILRCCLGIHAAWVALVLAAPSLPLHLPSLDSTGTVHILSLRPDIDTALVGVFAALQLCRLACSLGKRSFILLTLVLSFWDLIRSSSRAGTVAALAAIALVIVAIGVSRQMSRTVKGVMGATVVIVIMVAFAYLPGTNIGQRLGGSFGPAQASKLGAAAGATGTTRARLAAWGALSDYIDRKPSRLLFGVGFGPDFMRDSGALSLLVGPGSYDNSTPRSPHNYWLGTLARLGLIGLVLVAAVVWRSLTSIARRWRYLLGDQLWLLSALLVIVLLISASVGVVLESPFGAVPFWWAIGIIFGLRECGIQT